MLEWCLLTDGWYRQSEEGTITADQSSGGEEVATTIRYAHLHQRHFIPHHRLHRADHHLDPPSIVKQPPDVGDNKDAKSVSNAETAQPLAPPPRPAQIQQQNTADTSDYFSSVHNNSHFSLEPNPFEQSFGNPSSETPGKSILPPVAALTSPAPLTGNTTLGNPYGWSGSLRSGPLSPAMLSGPTGEGGYFDSHLRGGFPTPNESSLRTGLTPGGGGSMFPAPSPNSQAIYHLASGGATPSTLDFHRTALNAAAARKSDNYTNGGSSQATDQRAQVGNMDQSSHQQASHQHFGQHDNDAANGLYLLAQAGNESQSNNQFAIPNQPAHNVTMSAPSQETSPNMAKRAARNASGSIGGSLSGSVRGASEMSGEMSDGMDQSKPNTRAKNKRSSSGKGTTNNRRKAEDPSSKQPATKKIKANSNNSNNHNSSLDMDMNGMESDEEQNIKEEQYHENGKKMTDEEKRKNFLERNRRVIRVVFPLPATNTIIGLLP